ncbi:MAG: hypothetical protein GX493_02770 [Firmicutes bacterium]|nr:hypothetical protein [Bacillota bacterium]
MRLLKVAAIQAGVDPHWRREEWLDHLRWQLAACREEGVGLAVFPAWTGCYEETFPHGFPWRAAGELLGLLGGLAREAGVYLVPGTIPIREQERIFLRSFLFSPTGHCLGYQDQLCPPAGYEAGTELVVFPTVWGKVGLLIEGDATVPELARFMVCRGVEIVCHPTASPLPGPPSRHGLPQVVQAYRVFGVQAPLIGLFAGQTYRGRAKVLVPRAMTDDESGVMAQARDPSATEIVTATVDLDKLERLRAGDDGLHPFLCRDELPAAYRRLEQFVRAAPEE